MNPESPYPPNQGNPNGQQPYQPPQPMQPVPGQPYGGMPQQQPMQPAPQPSYAPLPPAPVPSIARKPSKKWVIMTFVFIFTTLIASGLAVWALFNYFEQRDTVQSQVSAAVATARKEEQDKAAEHLLEVENEPNRLFTGPEDYGRLTFNYSKLWSLYVARDAASGGTYEAYLNPASVPPISKDQQYALRVLIEQKDYDQVIKSYERLVDSGELKASSVDADGQNGTRLDGQFTDDIRGSAVIFKIRDKTVTLRTDATTFNKPFNELIKTITFNK